MYIQSVVLSALVASAFCLPSASVFRLVDDRIVGGEVGLIEKYPYLVSLRNDKEHHLCGGSIISRIHVVTAAHCVDNVTVPPSPLFIQAGSSFVKTSNGVIKKVVQTKLHPQYNIPDYDIAILTLESELEFGPRINKINIPTSDQVIPTGKNVKIMGWGQLREHGEFPNQFRVAEVPIIDHDDCKKAYENFENIKYRVNDRMICTSNSGRKGICRVSTSTKSESPVSAEKSADSGGALVHENTLFGIPSWVYNCGNETTPSVYASVPRLRSFIKLCTGL